MPKKFIQAMHMKKGALHRALNVPEGEKIPEKKMAKAAKSKSPIMRKRVALARTLEKIHKK